MELIKFMFIRSSSTWFERRFKQDFEIANSLICELNSTKEKLGSTICGYYCRKSGTRTVGTCVHITSVLWYLGYPCYNLEEIFKKKNVGIEILYAALEYESSDEQD